MNITEVRITRLTDSKTLALASITLDNEFVVSGLRVLNGQNGMWVSMPSKKNKEGTVNKDGSPKLYSDIAFPITKEARQTIQDSVLDKYNEEHFPMPEKNDRQKEYDNNDAQEDESLFLPF